MPEQLKPVAWQKRSRSKNYPGWQSIPESRHAKQSSDPANSALYEFRALYAIPSTHRVVSVQELEEILLESFASNNQVVVGRLRAIIDNASEGA